jgi:endoglucanase
VNGKASFCRLLSVFASASLSWAAENNATTDAGASALKVGVNGQIPVIVYDQFGYPTTAAKVAVIRGPQTGYDGADHFTPGSTYALVAKSTGQIVKKGAPVPWNGGATDPVSGDKA